MALLKEKAKANVAAASAAASRSKVSMSLSERIATADATGDRFPRITPGEYALEVLKTQFIEGQRGKPDGFVIEIKVLESEGGEASPEGETRSYWISLMYDSGLGAVKKFIANTAGLDLESLADDEDFKTLIDQACAGTDDNPLIGQKVLASGRWNRKRDYTNLDFRAVSEG